METILTLFLIFGNYSLCGQQLLTYCKMGVHKMLK